MPARAHFENDVLIPKAEIHVTEACNNRCAFCTTGWENAEQKGLRHVPREVIRTHLREAWEGGARRVLFQGGEPTLRPDLPELIADARAAGFPLVSVFTNARLASSPIGCDRLVAAKVSWFQVSVQGGDAASHDASVVAPGAFAQTIKGTRALLARGQRVKINAVLTRELLESLPAFARLICELRPEEVAFDTVKPTAAFAPGRADFATLAPRLKPYAAALRDAVLHIHAAGLVVRLTSMPPCLIPGAQAWVSEEAPTTLTRQLDGGQIDKHDWKRSMQVKAPGCATCAYDAVCGGVYRPYAEAHGLDELAPLRARAAPLTGGEGVPDLGGLTARLRAWFVRPGPAPIVVRTVEPLASGDHRLECAGPRGTVFVRIRLRDQAPSYAVTERFAVTWERPPDGLAPDVRVVDAVVRGLRQLEPQLAAADFTSRPLTVETPTAQTIIDVPSVCERSCAFCEISMRSREDRKPRGSDEQVLKLIDGAPGAVLFTGDDALSNPRIGEFISRAAKRGPVSVIGPPRSEVTAAKLPELVAAGLRSWTTVLLGTRQRTHDERAGLEGAWHALHQAAPAAKAAGLTLNLVTPLIGPVLDELSGLAELARSLSARPLTLLTYAPDSTVGDRFDALVPPFEVLRAALSRFASAPASAGVRVDAAPLCVLPEQWRAGSATRAERTDAALTACWPEPSCGSCALRAQCPGVLDTVLRAVGARGLTAFHTPR